MKARGVGQGIFKSSIYSGLLGNWDLTLTFTSFLNIIAHAYTQFSLKSQTDQVHVSIYSVHRPCDLNYVDGDYAEAGTCWVALQSRHLNGKGYQLDVSRACSRTALIVLQDKLTMCNPASVEKNTEMHDPAPQT